MGAQGVKHGLVTAQQQEIVQEAAQGLGEVGIHILGTSIYDSVFCGVFFLVFQLLLFLNSLLTSQASLLAPSVKSLPAVLETQVPFLGAEDAMEKEMAIHSSILAWKIPWTEEPSGLQSMESQRVGQD